MPQIELISALTGEKMGDIWVGDHPPPALTLNDYRRAVQAHIDRTAQERRYDTATSCASYVASTNPAWAAEAAALIAWRDEVWTQVYAAEAGYNPDAPPPSIADVIDGLPTIAWPAL